MDIIRKNLQEAQNVLRDFINNEQNLRHIEEAGKLFTQALTDNRKIISCGNGGSMCDAMHFAEELVGRFRADRRALPAIAISDASYITCTANDYGYDAIFSRFIEAFGKEGDILLAISTSGNSRNVIRAARAARDKGMKIVGLTGKDGGELAFLCDIEIRSPLTQYADRAQEIHIKVIHTLIDYIERNMTLK